MAIARDVARAQKQADAMRLRAAREQDRNFRANLRDLAREERENLRSLKEQARDEKFQYLEGRQEEAESLSVEAQQRLDELSGVLGFTLLVNDRVDFDALRILDTVEPFKASGSVRVAEIRPLEKDYLANANVPTGWRKLLPGREKKRIQALADAKQRFDRADTDWQKREEDRFERLEAEKRVHGNKIAALEAKKSARNAEVDAFKAEYDAGDPNAVVAYCTMVLERSEYPEYFPQKFSVAFTQASKLIVVEYELPNIEIIPAVLDFRYNRSQDEIIEKPRKPAEMKSDYQDVIASVALRTLHELFEAEHRGHVDVICVNGYIHTIDPATGRDIQPHLISVRTTSRAMKKALPRGRLA